MTKYIDAHNLAKVYMGKGKDKLRLAAVINELEFAPTADVVEVVRCKDCAVPHNRWTGCPKLNGLVTHPEFYCSYGERRKEDAEIY